MKSSVATIIFSIYFILVCILYYVLFHKHHKRNQIGLDELVTLVSNFFVTTTVSVLFIGVGIYLFIDMFNYLDERIEVISHIIVVLIIFVTDIFNYICYIKRKLIDQEVSDRVISKKSMLKAGEVLEFILFMIILFTPIWRINYLISIKDNYDLFVTELFKYIGLSVASLIILINLNPLDFKHGFKNCVLKKDVADKIIKEDKDNIETKKKEIKEVLDQEKNKEANKKVNKTKKK